MGKRKLMTMDEVLRMDIDKALVILRGKKVLEVDKYDYSKHPEAKKLRPSKAATHVPAWQAEKQKAEQIPAAGKPAKPRAPRAAPSAKAKTGERSGKEPASPPRRPTARSSAKQGQRVVDAEKDTILSPPKKEE